MPVECFKEFSVLAFNGGEAVDDDTPAVDIGGTELGEEESYRVNGVAGVENGVRDLVTGKEEGRRCAGDVEEFVGGGGEGVWLMEPERLAEEHGVGAHAVKDETGDGEETANVERPAEKEVGDEAEREGVGLVKGEELVEVGAEESGGGEEDGVELRRGEEIGGLNA